MIYAPITDHSGWANAEPGPDPIRNFVAEGVTSHASYVIKVRSARERMCREQKAF